VTSWLERLIASVAAKQKLIAVFYAVRFVAEVQNAAYSVIDASTMIAPSTRLGDLVLGLKT
jgi:hypothetical protein